MRPPKNISILAAATAVLLAAAALGEDVLSQDKRAFADGLMARGLYKLALPEYDALSRQTPPPAELDTVLYRLAECKRQTGDIRGAAALCERIEKEFPNGKVIARASITHALALDALGDKKRAGEIFDTIATDPSANMELRYSAMYFAGESKFGTGDFTAAKSRFSSLVTMAAKDKPTGQSASLLGFAKLYLAEIDAKAGTPEAVKNALAQYSAIADGADSPRIGAEALFKGAVLAYTSKNYDEAVARFAQLAAKYPGDVRAADALLPATWANFNAGRFAEALDLSAKAAAAPGADKSAKAECAYVKASALAGLLRRAEAVAAFDELISSYPDTKFAASARYERLVALFKDGKHAEVLSSAATFANPPDAIAPDLIWLQAESAEALGDQGRASQFYRMLSERFPQSRLAPDATYRFATHMREAKSWQEAAKGYQKIAANYKDSQLVPYALYSSACCMANIGRHEDAIRDFDALLTAHPNHTLVPEALLQKALAQQKTGTFKEAGATLDLLLSKYPGFARIGDAKFERARISYELKDYAAAEKLLGECLSANPTAETVREANFLLGLTLDAQGRGAEAAAKFQPLLTAPMRDKIPPDRLAWLADFQFAQKKYQEAADAAGELTKRSVTPEIMQSANVILARSQLALSNTNAAIAAFRAAADSPARTQYSAEAALRAGELLLEDSAQLAAAAKYLSQASALAATPETSSIRALAYRGLAECAEKRGDKEEAIRLNLAVSLLFDDKEVVSRSLKSAARLLDEAGRKEEADGIREELQARYPEEAGK